MKKLLLLLILALVSTPQYLSAAPIFSEPILAKAYEQVQIRIDAKVAKSSLDESAKAIIEQKKAYLREILQSIDKAYQKRDKKTFKEQIHLFQSGYKEAISAIESLKTANVIPSDHKNGEQTEGVSGWVGKSTDITYYANSFEWGHTANGNLFSQSFYSAAACNIPLNTLVQVGRGNNALVVKINDRPNCTKYPNLTDLTTTAFRVLGNISSGRLAGTIQTLGTVPKNYVKRAVQSDTFQELGIELDANIPNTYLKNETLHITGKELLGKENTVLYLQSPKGKDILLGMKKGDDGRFEYNYPLEEVGTYSLVIASGMGFNSTGIILDIFVLDDEIFVNKQLSVSPRDSELLSTLDTKRIEFSDLRALYLFRFPTKDFHTLTISDASQTFMYRGFDTISIPANALTSLDIEKPVDITVTRQKSSTAFSHDTSTTPVTVFQKTMTIVPGYREERNENITVSVDRQNLVLHGSIAKGKNVKNVILLTLPNGDVTKYTFDANAVDADGFLKREKVFEKTIPLASTGLYLVEVNYDNGFAAYNGPIVSGEVLAIYPNDIDTTSKEVNDKDKDNVRIESLNYVNKIRARSGKKSLVLDDTLNNLALIKAKDMATSGVLSHRDSHGDFIDGTAKRNNITITGWIGENIAWWNLSFRVLLIGLANSGGHRADMQDDWGKMGIGYAVKGGQVYYVQVFGE